MANQQSAPSQRIITAPFVRNRPPHTVASYSHCSRWTLFTLVVLRPLWRYRVEILLLSVLSNVVVVFASWSNRLTGSPLCGLVVSVLVFGGLLCVSRFRSGLLSLLHRRHVRRSFERACRFNLLVTSNDRTPRVRSVRKTPAGDLLTIHTPHSMSTEPLVAASEVLASTLKVKEVRVERDRHKAHRATVSIIRRDPLADPSPLSWPPLKSVSSGFSVWKPVPVGIDELGETVFLSLPERMILIGAETGGGKSVSLSQLVAIAALDPTCRLTLLDGKQVELAFWRSCADRIAGPSVSQAIEVLGSLRAEMDRRYEQLLSSGKRKITQTDGIPLEIVIVDELAYYVTMGEPKEVKEFERLFRDLVARGRAAGVVVIAATQKPSHDIIKTSIRDLFAIRWALRCTTPQASDTILGQGWASQGYSANDIDISCKGVGYLLHEGGLPIRLRSFFLSDDDLVSLAAMGAERRKAFAEHQQQIASQGEEISHDETTKEVVPITNIHAA